MHDAGAAPKGGRSATCATCGWLVWHGETLGCDRCWLHWSPGGRPLRRRDYSLGQAARLLGVSASEVESLFDLKPALRRGELTAIPRVDRLLAHDLAALFRLKGVAIKCRA